MEQTRSGPGYHPQPAPETTPPQRPAHGTAPSSVGRRTGPRRMSSVVSQIPAWRQATPEQRRCAEEARHLAHVKAQRRRDMILRHPDLAERLAVALDLSSPANWNGYVAPSDDGKNRSPLRAVVCELRTEAEARRAGEAAA